MAHGLRGGCVGVCTQENMDRVVVRQLPVIKAVLPAYFAKEREQRA